MKTLGDRTFRAWGARTMLVAGVLTLVAPMVASADPGHRVPAPPPPPPAFSNPVLGYSNANGHVHASTVHNDAEPPFLAAAHPIRAYMDHLHLLDVDTISATASIPLAGGGRSPSDTVYVRVRAATADNLSVTQDVNGRSIEVHNVSNRDPNLLAKLGNESSVIEVWATVNGAKACITPETLNTLVTSYAGVFGGRLDEVLNLISTTFQPYLTGPLKRVGPCIPLKELVPIAAVIVQAGVPLPGDIPLEKVDLNVYAAHITSEPNLRSATVPALTLAVK